MSDPIDRQEAIDAMADVIWHYPNELYKGLNAYENALKLATYGLNSVPSAQPELMRAKWIATTSLQEGQITCRDYKCSNCSHHRERPMNFCEVCGAKMER